MATVITIRTLGILMRFLPSAICLYTRVAVVMPIVTPLRWNAGHVVRRWLQLRRFFPSSSRTVGLCNCGSRHIPFWCWHLLHYLCLRNADRQVDNRGLFTNFLSWIFLYYSIYSLILTQHFYPFITIAFLFEMLIYKIIDKKIIFVFTICLLTLLPCIK